jgi:hypothetical protein
MRRMKFEKERLTRRECLENRVRGRLPKVDLFDGGLCGMYLEPLIVRDCDEHSHCVPALAKFYIHQSANHFQPSIGGRSGT